MGLLTPRRYLTDVAALDLGELWDAGKRALLLDRDNTLVPRDTKVVPDAVVSWIARAHEMGFKLCFISNNWAKNVRPDAERFGAELVSRSAKPLPFAFWRALSKLSVSPREAVIVGDQVFTDVLGGNLAGIYTVLVQPQTTVDLAHTLVLRKLEARVLKGLEPEPAPCGGSDPGASASC